MERLSVMKSLNRGGLPPSHPYNCFPPKRDASFSAYLQPDDLAYAPKIKEEEEEAAPPPAATADDAEISIFDAQKYFNEMSDHPKQQRGGESMRMEPAEQGESEPVTRASSMSSYWRNYRGRSFQVATPTASSEASWNSKTGLLRNPPGAMGVNVMTRSGGGGSGSSINGKKIHHLSNNNNNKKWFLRRKCPCTGRKDVEIKEKKDRSRSRSGGTTDIPEKVIKMSSPKSCNPDWEQHDHGLIRIPITAADRPNFSSSTQLARRVLATGPGFSFPVLSQPPAPAPPRKLVFASVRNNPIIPPLLHDDPPRVSLEVFRPSAVVPPPRVFAPADRRTFTFSASPKSRVGNGVVDDDVASDASSDLFEIESFATQTTTTSTTNNYPMYHKRDSLEEASRRLGYCRRSIDECGTPYEPSEASIDWSVTTAEGFDRGSVTMSASEIVDDEMAVMREELQRVAGRRRGKGGMLMSCRCEKAVSVGPGPTPVKEGPGGSTARHVSSRDKPPLARSHSARLSLTFAT